MSQHPDHPPNADYYSARAAEERRLAMASADPKARAIHLELAERYAVLARSGDLEPPQVVGDEQRTG